VRGHRVRRSASSISVSRAICPTSTATTIDVEAILDACAAACLDRLGPG
jgi:hypothetical protein